MAITQMTRFKSDKTEEMIKNAKNAKTIFERHSAEFLGMSRFHTGVWAGAAKWLPVSIAPSDGDLEVCVIDYDGIIHALVYPCHKNGAEWVDASNKKHVDIQPTHWRKWTVSH